MREKAFFIGILMVLATVAAASAHSYNRGSPVYGVLPNEGLTYARYPSYGTEYRGTSHTYKDGVYRNHRHNDKGYRYKQHYYKKTMYKGWPYHFKDNSIYATSHHKIVHYVDRPILYPGIYNFRPVRWQ